MQTVLYIVLTVRGANDRLTTDKDSVFGLPIEIES